MASESGRRYYGHFCNKSHTIRYTYRDSLVRVGTQVRTLLFASSTPPNHRIRQQNGICSASYRAPESDKDWKNSLQVPSTYTSGTLIEPFLAWRTRIMSTIAIYQVVSSAGLVSWLRCASQKTIETLSRIIPTPLLSAPRVSRCVILTIFFGTGSTYLDFGSPWLGSDLSRFSLTDNANL
ncbi:hypothetical protein EV424DRAFT_67582 [Suillus variegatus]|nr:hypothetical protein EV424DRAFT_67582 [Suillus variegatus]